ncbi:MAG: hypothetical protein P8N91_06030 [Flavobacteriaceae bacterium]|nr:hypothetical protein [Flavobacteriaceae bacterium]
MKTLEDNDHMVSTSLKSISREDGKYYINENFSLGYAYDTYGADQLSGLNLKAHEIAVRFMFGTKSDTPELEEPSEN